jgi:hypothetical protein
VPEHNAVEFAKPLTFTQKTIVVDGRFSSAPHSAEKSGNTPFNLSIQRKTCLRERKIHGGKLTMNAENDLPESPIGSVLQTPPLDQKNLLLPSSRRSVLSFNILGHYPSASRKLSLPALQCGLTII